MWDAGKIQTSQQDSMCGEVVKASVQSRPRACICLLTHALDQPHPSGRRHHLGPDSGRCCHWAGVNGASVAYQLAKRGVKNVLLLERRFPASGPTGRSSGIVRQHYSIETLARMALNSLRTFRRFVDEVGGSAGFVQSGVVFAVSEEGLPLLRKNVDMQQHLGIHSEILSARELAELDPFLFHDDLAAGAYEPDSGYADPALTTNSFVEAAQRLGVQLCP
ncbi:MAG: FAD-binding oxidoreductase, partial [Acidobacteria bacterium]|nr:FAD-binding oxidoreductase [Acidobacteriota bacterium]